LQPTNREEILSRDYQDWDIQDEFFAKPQDFISNISDLFNDKFKALLKFPNESLNDFARSFCDFIGRILNRLRQYLPLENELVVILDFVELKDGYIGFKEKVKQLNKVFNLVTTEEEKNILSEELLRIKNIKSDYYRDPDHSNLYMWDRLKHFEKLILLPQIVRFAEALPTSSVTIEQFFSVIKLVKTDLRNRLQELSSEGLVLIGQEFRIKSPESIKNEKIIELATPVIKDLCLKRKQYSRNVMKKIKHKMRKKSLMNWIHTPIKLMLKLMNSPP